MKEEMEYEWVKGNRYCERIKNFLEEIDEIIQPKLSVRVNIGEYANKLAEKADTLFILWEGKDIASCSLYCNEKQAYISSIAVKKEFLKQQIGTKMMAEVKRHAMENKCGSIGLEVDIENALAVSFYCKNGFNISEKKENWLKMVYQL